MHGDGEYVTVENVTRGLEVLLRVVVEVAGQE